MIFNKTFVLILMVGSGMSFSASNAYAAEYNSLIGNPFVFCSAPKPCKHCQPYRKIYTEICGSQSKAKKDAQTEIADAEQQPTSLNAAQLKALKKDGAAALSAAMERGDTIFSMDENTSDLGFNAFAVGWNAEWAIRRVQQTK